MTNQRSPEVLVIGAGPGGSTAAMELARAGHEVLLVDRADFPREKVCGDGITPGGVATLERLGLLDAVRAAGATVVDRVRIVGPFGVGYELRMAEAQPTKPRALVLPRIVLDDILRVAAVEAGAEWMASVRVDRIERQHDHVTAVHATSAGSALTFRPRQLVVAVGGSAGMLRRSGFIYRRPSQIRTVRAYFEGADHPVDRYDFIFDLELLPGYGWLFPAPGGLCNVGIGVPPTAWSTRRPARALFEEFVERQRRLGTLTGARQVSPLRGAPLTHGFPVPVPAGRNWVLVGEAAGLVNPLTGEGIDLALESGRVAAATMHENLLSGKPDHVAYERALLERYGSLFAGLRLLRDTLVTPAATDYALWAMGRDATLAQTLLGVAQGLTPAHTALSPATMARLLSPMLPFGPMGGGRGR